MKLHEEKWNFLAVAKLSSLLLNLYPRHNGSFYYLNCLHLFRASEIVTPNEIVIPHEENKILKCCQGQKYHLLFMLILKHLSK